MKNLAKWPPALLLIPIFFFGCYPEEDLYYADTDVAITDYDENYNFSRNLSYTIVDTVMHIVGEREDPPTEKGIYDDFIFNEVTKHMAATGYEVADLNDTLIGVYPDLVLTISVMETDNYSYYYYPWWGYWDYYPGWYWYGYKSAKLKSTQDTEYYYYPYYPWYPGGGSVYYAYSSGTIMLDLIDYGQVKQENDGLPVVWAARVNGVLSGNKQNEQTRIENTLQQCFEQSPYLGN